MKNPFAQWRNSRKVVERIVITGVLMLDTPAHFGNGDPEGLTDIPLLRDPLKGLPLLTGASIAGALRNYLREYTAGYGWEEAHDGATLAEQLFGYIDDDRKAAVQSWLMIDDALGTQTGVELRDGVALNPKTRTAEDKKKYDVELLNAGTTFDLCFELWLTETNSTAFLRALATALKGLENREIGLGQRKRRGLGECHAKDWCTRRYSMKTADGLLDWLDDAHTHEIAGLPQVELGPDNRRELRIEATFALNGSLLIRSGSGGTNAPDMVHLRSYRAGKDAPILSGTSAAGAIRGRALRIANTLLRDKGNNLGQELVDAMFGRRIEDATDDPSGSRVLVRETIIKCKDENQKVIDDRVQNRVKIDRFTGGSYPAALFSQQPLWGTSDHTTLVTLDVRLRRPVDTSDADFDAQAGLLLLVLKDLWTGDLPLGGESSVGRGRLIGQGATITYDGQTWELNGAEQIKISGSERQTLEGFVKAVPRWTPEALSQARREA